MAALFRFCGVKVGRRDPFARLSYQLSIVRKCHLRPWKDKTYGGSVEVKVGDRPLLISVGKFARFADGAALAQYGDTSVLVTAVGKSKSSPSSFLPLTVRFGFHYSYEYLKLQELSV